MRLAGRKAWRASSIVATVDHNVPTTDRKQKIADPNSRKQVETLDANAREFGVIYFPINDVRQGIVHVIGPEQGFTLPGMTVVCGGFAHRDRMVHSARSPSASAPPKSSTSCPPSA